MALLTKTEQVAKYIRNQIQRGTWLPGQRLPMPSLISDKLGVSPITVRNTMAMLASEGVLERRQKAGTFVAEEKAVGTVVILGRTELLASSEGHYYKELWRHAKEGIEANGYRAVLVAGHGDTPEEFYNSINLLDKPFTNNVLGIISLIELCELDARIADAKLNVVSIVPGDSSDRHSVVLDFKKMFELAEVELKRHGYDDYAIMYSRSLKDEEDRALHVEYACMYRDFVGGDESRQIPVEFTNDYRNALDAFKRYWARPDRSKAIFFAEDAVLDVASRAFAELGLKIPDDLAIITHANVGRHFYIPCSLVRIEFDPKELVHVAWDMLNDLIDGKLKTNQTLRVAPKVRNGESLG